MGTLAKYSSTPSLKDSTSDDIKNPAFGRSHVTIVFFNA